MAERPGAAKVEEEEIDSVELPAPAGWKKFVPKNDDIPKRNGVLFISPTGEEIRNRRRLILYFRSHPGGPSPSEFDWTYGGILRQSARISRKNKVAQTPEDPNSHRKISKLNGPRNKHRKYDGDGDSEKEEKDEVPETDQTDTQVVDAEMKVVDDNSSVEEKVEPAAKTVEDEIEAKVGDQDSAEGLEGENINEPENLQPEDSNKDVPVISAPAEAPAVSEIQETPAVEEAAGKDVTVLNEHGEFENLHSYVNEEEEKRAPVFSVAEVTEDENAAGRENRVNSKASPRDAESGMEVLREKEVKDRAFLNEGHKWEQKTVSSS